MADPKLRNLKITQGYYALTIALTRLFGAKNVTWCAYATQGCAIMTVWPR